MHRITLHIGTQKTGTTALQTFLGENSENLAAQGLMFPSTFSKYPDAIRERNARFLTLLVKDIVAPGRVYQERIERSKLNRDSFIEQTRDAEHVIISDEALWHEGAQRPRFWKALKEQLVEMGFEDIDIVVYLRRQDDYIISLWNQRVKAGARLTASCTDFTNSTSSQKLMDYATVIDEMAEVFGSKNIKVRVFRREELVDSDIRLDFCSLLGIDPQGFTMEAGKPNLSLSNNVAEIKRAANLNEDALDYDDIFRMSAKRVSALPDASDGTALLSPEERKSILERYKSGNEKIAREYLGREDEVLFPAPDNLPPAWEMDIETYSRDIVRIFVDALAAEHERLLKSEKQVAKLKHEVKHVTALKKKAAASEKSAAALEARADALEKQVSKLDRQTKRLQKRLDEITADKGILKRIRKKIAK